MQVNGAAVFTNKKVEMKGKDGKNGAWTESSIVILLKKKFVVSNGKIVVTDDCSENCEYSWARITTF
jgi:hypothetical protein